MVEKSSPTKEILDQLLQIRLKRKKPLFDDKTQLDLNCLWISSLIAADDILPEKKYLKLAEEFFIKVEKNIYRKQFIIVFQKILFF